MAHIQKIEVKPYIDILMRRKWWIAVSFVVVTIAGFGYYKIAPEIYQATTLILVEPQKVPDSYVKSVVSDTVESRLHTITQQVHSRTNLENIIEKLGLDKEPEKIEDNIFVRLKKYLNFENKDQENRNSLKKMNLVESLRKNIKVSLQGRGGNNAFQISFTWHDPEVAARVTNFIAEKYIEENLNVREERAMATTDFLEREASRIRYELEAKEKELEDFKKKHMGMLPSELESNMNLLNQLKNELNNLEKRLDTERQMAMMMGSQMHSMNDSANLESLFSFEEEDTLADEASMEVQTLQEELKKMRVRYTESHPDVVELKRRIKMLKAEQEEKEKEKESKKIEPEEDPLAGTFDMADFTMSAQKNMQNKQIESYENQIRDVRAQIEVYKERVERTSQVELAMTKILRDYQTVKGRYEDLLAKSLSARMAEELERRQKGEQFRIIDPAVAPAKPFSPDLKKIMLLAAAAGLGLGCGLGFLRETMDPCFYDPDEIESDLGANVILSLPAVNFKSIDAVAKKGEKRKAAQQG